MSRRFMLVTLLAAATATLSACSSSGDGVHTQDPTSSTSTSPKSSVSAPATSAPASPSSAPTTTGFGAAQPAIDVVLRVQSAYTTAVRHPATANASAFDKFLAGQAKIAFDGSLKSAKSAGVEYRGTAPTPRIKVITTAKAGSLPEVVVQNCPLASSSDPFVAYYVKTGKAVPVSKPKVPQPYAQTAKVFKINGSWVITSYTTDNTKTCTP